MKIFGQDYRQAKDHRSAGSHRSRPPSETLADFARHMPALGITRLANVTGLDRIGIAVYMAIRPNARSLAVSQGKGIDVDHAKASALMESVENWHAEWIDLPTRVGSYWEMCARGPTIDITRLPLRTGAELRPDVPAPWLEGYDLMRAQPTWVPYEFVTMNTLLSHGMRLTWFNSSNGLASGNHLLEAVLHGLLEVAERDALAAWRAASPEAQRATAIDLATVDDPHCRRLLDCYTQAQVEVAVWDVTCELGLPTYQCAIGEPHARFSWRNPGVFHGFGCHLSPAVALARALCEAAQSRLTVISGSRDDNPLHVYIHQRDPDNAAARYQAYFGSTGTLSFGARQDRSSASFEEDIARVLRALGEAGLDSAIAVDLTRAGLNIPVVKVIVPGARIGLHEPPGPAGARAGQPQ